MRLKRRKQPEQGLEEVDIISPPHDTGIGSKTWIIGVAFTLLSFLLIFLWTRAVKVIDRVDELEDKMIEIKAVHSHPQDPAIGRLEDRIVWLERRSRSSRATR